MVHSDTDWVWKFDNYLSATPIVAAECEKAANDLTAAKLAKLTAEERSHGYVSQVITPKQIRLAIARECARLVERDGPDAFLQQFAQRIIHLLQLIYRREIRFCKFCRWPFFPHRGSRTLCGSPTCTKRRRIEKESYRELGRRLTGKSAERKREDRAIAKVIPRDNATLNREIDAIAVRVDPLKKSRWLSGKEHIRNCRHSPDERKKLLRFLGRHAPTDFTIEVRAALRLKPSKT